MVKTFSNYLHGISFFPLSRQQKHDTPHAITTMRITETQPTIKSSFKLIWQFLPANQARQSQLTWASLLMTHWPFLLHKSHSVVVAVEMKSRIWYFRNIKQQIYLIHFEINTLDLWIPKCNLPEHTLPCRESGPDRSWYWSLHLHS